MHALQRVRSVRCGRGRRWTTQELVKFAQLFNDELTLDNLERIHLVNLCRFVGIQPFGTDTFLVARLRSHLHTIKARTRPAAAPACGVPKRGMLAAVQTAGVLLTGSRH